MTENTSGQSMWGIALVVILLLFFIFNGRGVSNTAGTVIEGGCSRVSNCEVEKSGIVNSATTNYNILAQGDLTREAILKDGMETRTQATQIYVQQLRDELLDVKNEKTALKQEISLINKFGELNQANNLRFYEIQRALDKKPDSYPCYASAAYPCGTVFPGGCGTSTMAMA